MVVAVPADKQQQKGWVRVLHRHGAFGSGVRWVGARDSRAVGLAVGQPGITRLGVGLAAGHPGTSGGVVGVTAKGALQVTDTVCRLFLVGASFTQGTISSIPVGGSISPKGFLLLVLLLVEIIVTVVIVIVILIVVVGDDVSLIVKLLFVIIGWAYAFYQDRVSSVKVPVANVTLFSSAQLLRENTDSVLSNQQMRSTAPSVPLK
ncbi:hypothetical protein Tco_1220977 [Tanacetum coccineum]